MVNISYSPSTFEEFEKAVRLLHELNALAPAIVERPRAPRSASNGAANDDGPKVTISDTGIYEAEFIRRSKQKRMRCTDEENERIKAGTATREDIARERLDAMGPEDDESVL